MVRISSGSLVPGAQDQLKHAIAYSDGRRGIVARAWPRKRGPTKNLKLKWLNDQWAVAARMASNPEPLAAITASLMAKGTQNVPRDILVMASYGTLIEFSDDAGNDWRPSNKAVPWEPV